MTNILKKIWHFLWIEESFASWVVLLLLGLIFIVFVFFPVSSSIFNSDLPFVVIESGSMHHVARFDKWWESSGWWYENRSISKEQFKEFSFKSGLDIGDIIAVKGQDDYNIGDIIIFDAEQEKPIIHRIIYKRTKCNVTETVRDNIIKTTEENCSLFQTKGDNNNGQSIFELNISKQDILGKASFAIPKLGYTKLIPCMIFPQFCTLIDKIRA